MWVKRTNDDLALLENGLILDKNREQSIIEEVCQNAERKNVNKIMVCKAMLVLVVSYIGLSAWIRYQYIASDDKNMLMIDSHFRG